MKKIIYPFLPEGREILYVPASHPFMILARQTALEKSKDNFIKTGCVIAKGECVLGTGANGSDFHETNECVRKVRGCKTGEGYELCPGCHPDNHAEYQAILDACSAGATVKDADLYLWGHWWLCEDCWKRVIQYEIGRCYLLERSEILFNREHPENRIGKM